jgi:ligand-binding SRPBCC domain-containing protein
MGLVEMRAGGDVSISIDAPPEVAWALVADVTRIGELDTECRRAEWIGGASGPAVGVRFRGHNRVRRMRWSRRCEVLVCEPAREFTWQTLPRWFDSTIWRYRFEPDGNATRASASYEIVKAPPRLLAAWALRYMPHHADRRPDMRVTLESLKRAAEREAAQRT